MSCPKLRFAISFLDKLEKVTGISAFTRTADTNTSSNKVSLGNKITEISSFFVKLTNLETVLKPKNEICNV